jgi:nitric oxide synthase-interacting protein
MTKHSKNNTASSTFSYAEYKKLDYGTKHVRLIINLISKVGLTSDQKRLGNESMRRFDACALCLQRAREPVACHKGHLFCKECVYTDMCMCSILRDPVQHWQLPYTDVQPVTQKKDMQRQKEKIETMKKEAEEEKERAKEAARERVRLEFEKGHLRLASTPVLATTSGAESKEREYLVQIFSLLCFMSCC